MKFAATFYKKRRCAIIAIRKKQLTVRFTEEEYAALKGKCEIAGMKMEPFVRSLVDGCRIKPAPPDSYNKLRQQLSAIGNNLNQLTHVANATGRVSASQLDRAQSLLEDMWRCVRDGFATSIDSLNPVNPSPVFAGSTGKTGIDIIQNNIALNHLGKMVDFNFHCGLL